MEIVGAKLGAKLDKYGAAVKDYGTRWMKNPGDTTKTSYRALESGLKGRWKASKPDLVDGSKSLGRGVSKFFSGKSSASEVAQDVSAPVVRRADAVLV